MVEGLTLAELAETAAAMLGDERGAGRVRPTQRTLRYYSAQRLLDPPLELRGPRSAYYGRRHLLQVVAVKKLQAAGRSLDEIRELLAAASNDRLQELAGVAGPALTALTPSLASSEALRGSGDAPDPVGASAVASARPSAFWRIRPDSGPPSAPLPEASSPHDQVLKVDRDATGALLTGVPVGPVVVLLPAARPLDAADVTALADAARPLLAALADRGLLTSATNPATQRSMP